MTTMHKRYSLWQRFIMALRDVNAMSTCSMICPGCGSSNVNGDEKSWICMSCGSQGQS